MKQLFTRYIHLIGQHLDIIAVGYGLFALINAFFCPHPQNWIIDVGALIALIYILLGAWLFFFRKARFDWTLVYGKFIYKVVALVILTPLLLTSALDRLSPDIDPTELVCDDNLYKQEKNAQEVEAYQGEPSTFWTVYYHFIDPGNQHISTTPRGRQWSAIIAILGIFLLNGLLVTSLIGSIDNRKNKWLTGGVRYHFLRWRKHYVIIGANDLVVSVVKRIFEKRENTYIVILTSSNVEDVRNTIYSHISESQQKRVIIYSGERISESEIKELYIRKAEEVYILGEDSLSDSIETYHDTMNMECLRLINKEAESVARFQKSGTGDNRLVCRMMFEYQTSFNLFQTTDINDKKINFRPFNYYEMWAQKVLVCQDLTAPTDKSHYIPLEGYEGIKSEDNSFVHLVIVGMSRMGIAMAIEAAHLAHYPNFETQRKRTRITFIDNNMKQERHQFMERFKDMFLLARRRDVMNFCENSALYNNDLYPWISPLTDPNSTSPYRGDYLGDDFIDIEWEFINGSVEHPAIQRYLVDASADDEAKLTIAICLPDNNRAIAAATYLSDKVYHSANTKQVLIYQRLNDEMVKQLSLNNPRFRAKLKAFGMAQDCYDARLTALTESIDKGVGKAYKQYYDNIRGSIISKFKEENSLDTATLKQLSPQVAFIFDDSIYSNEQGYIITTWENWFVNSENISKYDKWEASRNACWEEIDKHIVASLNLKRPDFIAELNQLQECNKGKSKAAKMWSNKYSILTMWSKFRSIEMKDNTTYDPTNDNLDDYWKSALNDLGKVEHNRWVVEQLLMRYRPLLPEEQKVVKMTTIFAPSKLKESLKGDFAHLDICSNDRLQHIDHNVVGLDKALLEVLPEEYRNFLSGNKK